MLPSLYMSLAEKEGFWVTAVLKLTRKNKQKMTHNRRDNKVLRLNFPYIFDNVRIIKCH